MLIDKLTLNRIQNTNPLKDQMSESLSSKFFTNIGSTYTTENENYILNDNLEDKNIIK